ncbi:MAG: DNA alkylation repair protein [Anaerolineae bacterium]|nr:DNA alkylation repair protein [Phycisphaerae bacterium]
MQMTATVSADVKTILAALKRAGSKRIRDEMQPRYGIVTDKAFGVGMSAMQKIAKSVRGKDAARNHDLADALWKTGWYEARMVACMIDEPSLVTSAQMDRWCRDFDNWGICDTVCFKLFDRTPHAFGKVAKWADKRDEFEKRAAFALLASLAGHDKTSGDEQFAKCLPLIEHAAGDERNFVKKGVSWALRGIGQRSAALNAAAVNMARRLAESADSTERWLGKDVLRDITRPAVSRKVARKE